MLIKLLSPANGNLQRIARGFLRPEYLAMAPKSSFATQPIKGEMLKRQNELPKLPVPPLKESIDKYLKSVEPFLDQSEMEHTKKLAAKLTASGGVGEKLHKLLEERANKMENWLSDWWLQGAYLGYRNPVVVYSSPAMTMPRQSFKSGRDQLAYAASLVNAVLDFKAQIDTEAMSTEVAGRAPLDMMQYKNILGTHREPHIPLDKLFLRSKAPHIIVAHQGNFYKVVVYDDQGHQLETPQILAQLHQVIEHSHSIGKGQQVGVLTTWHRDLWSQTFEQLSSHPTNKQTLTTIRDSIIVLCLDDPMPLMPWETKSAYQLLVGGEQGEQAGNRWCDKTLQFIVGAEGNVGVLYEHSPAEGPPVSAMIDFCAKQASVWAMPPQDSKFKPEKLDFVTNVEIEKHIESAKKDLQSLVDDLDLYLYTFEHFGKNFVKNAKLSPDSFIQMAFQLTFYRMHAVPGATYETATLRRFLHGRTETIRSCSTEAINFCKSFLSANASKNEKVESLRKAVQAHKDYTNQAVQGAGIDRLFFGMKMMAAEKDIDIPEFFFDKAMAVSTHFRMSTSQVAAKSPCMMFYGPLVPDGYGCCYNPVNDKIYFGLSAFKSCPTTDLAAFRTNLEKTLLEMKDYLDADYIKSKL